MTTQEAFFRFDWNRRKRLNPLRMRYTMTRADKKIARIALAAFMEQQMPTIKPEDIHITRYVEGKVDR